MGDIDDRLKSLGITLPRPSEPAGSYVPVAAVRNSGDLYTAYVSGQIPLVDGSIAYTGKVSENNMGTARESARICAINVLAQLKGCMEGYREPLDSIVRLLSIAGFVNSDPGFTAHPAVIDAASSLFLKVLGERGRHSRVAVGAASLPLDSMTEIAAVAEIRIRD